MCAQVWCVDAGKLGSVWERVTGKIWKSCNVKGDRDFQSLYLIFENESKWLLEEEICDKRLFRHHWSMLGTVAQWLSGWAVWFGLWMQVNIWAASECWVAAAAWNLWSQLNPQSCRPDEAVTQVLCLVLDRLDNHKSNVLRFQIEFDKCTWATWLPLVSVEDTQSSRWWQ